MRGSICALTIVITLGRTVAKVDTLIQGNSLVKKNRLYKINLTKCNVAII